MLANVVMSDIDRQKKYEDDLRQWSQHLQLLCDTVKAKIYNVLLFPEGWLVDVVEVSLNCYYVDGC